jgi:hypothetical protein
MVTKEDVKKAYVDYAAKAAAYAKATEAAYAALGATANDAADVAYADANAALAYAEAEDASNAAWDKYVKLKEEFEKA